MAGIHFIGIILLIGGLVGVLFRTLALSSLSNRLTRHCVWVFDVGIRYGWVAGGIAGGIVILNVRSPVSLSEIAGLTTYWLISLAAVWFIPPRLV